MSPEWVAIVALVALFVIGTVLPINMGALAYVAAWLVGMYSLGLDEKEILAGVSGDLVLTLIGVTFLFALARDNGTVDLIVATAVRARARAGGADPVGDVRGHRRAHRDRRREPGGVRDHRPDRAGLRGPLRHQPADDGHDRRPRRPGRRLLADQHLRHHHQLGDGRRRAPDRRADDLPGQPAGEPLPGRRPLPRPRRPPPGARDRRPGRRRRRCRGSGGAAGDGHRGGSLRRYGARAAAPRSPRRPRARAPRSPRPSVRRRSAADRAPAPSTCSRSSRSCWWRWSRWCSTRTSASSRSPPPSCSARSPRTGTPTR